MPATLTHFSEAEVEGGLAGWARMFAGYRGPRILGISLLIALAARLALGSWGWEDAAIFVGLLVLQPFSEWVLHVTVLHSRPFVVAGRTMELYAARKHREHHLDPRDVAKVFIQQPTLIGILASLVVIAAATRSGHVVTADCSILALLLTYEWSHFLIHSPYRPKTALYRSIWRAHRLHHYKNERYWFGITSNIADRVLRTFPDKSEVATSPTARNLAA